jgi:hypothetical protein
MFPIKTTLGIYSGKFSPNIILNLNFPSWNSPDLTNIIPSQSFLENKKNFLYYLAMVSHTFLSSTHIIANCN